MAYTTELTEDCLGIYHRATGVLTGDELLAASVAGRQLVQNTENFQYEFSDMSRVTGLQVDPSIVAKIVEEDHVAAKWRPHAIIVIVAPRDDTYELARQWEEQVQDLDWIIHISRERDEAVRWLGEYLKIAQFDIPVKKDEISQPA